METREQRSGPMLPVPECRVNGGEALVTGEAVYCAYCGTELTDTAPAARRFGEPFCSEAHADAFASEVRAAKVEVAAPESSATGTHAAQGGASGQKAEACGWSFGRMAKWALCCGAPLLALAFLAGGGGLLLGASAAALPYLALLACPLAMYFMMRGMQHGERPRDSRSNAAPGSDHRTDG